MRPSQVQAAVQASARVVVALLTLITVATWVLVFRS